MHFLPATLHAGQESMQHLLTIADLLKALSKGLLVVQLQLGGSAAARVFPWQASTSVVWGGRHWLVWHCASRSARCI
jgi:hypothetical protein